KIKNGDDRYKHKEKLNGEGAFLSGTQFHGYSSQPSCSKLIKVLLTIGTVALENTFKTGR
ncbi:hypothetical protein OFN49_40935, partial [Escherichia coli]|nr:hypothetical protein [Escherichia coli]